MKDKSAIKFKNWQQAKRVWSASLIVMLYIGIEIGRHS